MPDHSTRILRICFDNSRGTQNRLAAKMDWHDLDIRHDALLDGRFCHIEPAELITVGMFSSIKCSQHTLSCI